MAWQDEHTAPKDGTFVDLWVHDSLRADGERWTDCLWRNDRWFTVEGELVEAYSWIWVTHWMPRPDAPDMSNITVIP